MFREGLFHDVPAHRITRLRRQGERYFADGLRELPDNRRLAILAVCAFEWEMFLADAVVETHDRIVGRTYREAARTCDAQLGNETASVREALRAFAELGTALIGAKDTGETLDAVIADGPGWEGLGDLVARAAALANTVAADPLNHVLGGYSRFRRYTPRMLRTLDIEASPVAKPLLEAVDVLRSDATARPTGFLRPNSKWSRLLRTQSDHRHWETAVLFHLRDAFRAGDVWLARSRRYGDIRRALLSAPAVADADRSLPVPASPHDWLAERRFALDEGLRRLAAAARARAIAGDGSIEDSMLRVERTEGAVPDGAADLVADLYRRMPDARITDILLEVDDATRFTEAFTHLRTGSPCRDRIGLLNVLLAEGINLGLRKMAEATTTHGFWELMRIARWHVEGEAYDRALSTVVEAQAALPMATFWGTGRTASSDGQFFPAGGRGEALNLVNARYGTEPGVKAYSHVSDRFSPFATQTIPATVHEAPYILDGLLMNETGRRVREQYADTGGFTDHVFAACSILGYAFVPRIRDLPSKRLYVFERAGVPKHLRPLVGGKVNVDLIDRNWADILRVAATMAAGTMRPSQILRKLAAYPRQNELAAALREGRPRRTLPVHDRLGHGPRHAPARPGRLEQGRGAPCPQARYQLPPTRRTARPNRGGTALPGRRPQLAGRDHHLLEHAEARRGRRRQERSRPQDPARIPGPHLAARMGTHQPDRRIPLARHRPTGNAKLSVGFRPLPQTTRVPLKPRVRLRRRPPRGQCIVSPPSSASSRSASSSASDSTMPKYSANVASTTERTASRNAAEGAQAPHRGGVVLVGHLVEGRDGQPLGWRGDAAVDTLSDDRAGCPHERPELGVVELVRVEHPGATYLLFASIEPGRQGSAPVRMTAAGAGAPAAFHRGGVVRHSEQLPLSQRRIDLGGCRGPEALAVVDVDQEQSAARSGGHSPSTLRHPSLSSAATTLPGGGNAAGERRPEHPTVPGILARPHRGGLLPPSSSEPIALPHPRAPSTGKSGLCLVGRRAGAGGLAPAEIPWSLRIHLRGPAYGPCPQPPLPRTAQGGEQCSPPTGTRSRSSSPAGPRVRHQLLGRPAFLTTMVVSVLSTTSVRVVVQDSPLLSVTTIGVPGS